MLKNLYFFCREREKNELKLKVEELEGFKSKYEEQKKENEVGYRELQFY